MIINKKISKITVGDIICDSAGAPVVKVLETHTRHNGVIEFKIQRVLSTGLRYGAVEFVIPKKDALPVAATLMTTEEKIFAILNERKQWAGDAVVRIDDTPFYLKPYQDTIRLYHNDITLRSAPEVAMLSMKGWVTIRDGITRALQAYEKKPHRRPAFTAHKIMVIARDGGFCLEEQGGNRRRSKETFPTRIEASRAINGLQFEWEVEL